jgi:acetylornithine/succinyldiaminopimelate/putrescine aminotransferase
MTDTSAVQSEMDREDRYVLPTYSKLPFQLVKGRGNEVFDSAGRRYLDLYGGHAVCVLGHSHPRWVEALARQAGEFGFYSNVCYHPLRAEAAERLVRASYPSMRQVFFCNSGTEANETALKIARRFTGRSRVVAMREGFHGRTVASLSVTGIDSMRRAFPENLESFTDFVPFGDLDAIRRLDATKAAALILEPVQSMAGVYVAEPSYYRGLREHCTRHGVVLIFDEVQTGAGRTGAWFAGAHWGVEPDLVSCAKGIGGGFPVGAVIVNEAISRTVQSGDQGTTFGGGPMAAAAIAETFRILEEEGLPQRVARLSGPVFERLRGLIGKGLVRDVRGLGYLIGIECASPVKPAIARLREKGILVGGSNRADVLRLLPPFTVGEAEWEEFFRAFEPLALGRES